MTPPIAIRDRLDHADLLLAEAENAIESAGQEIGNNVMAHARTDITDRTDRAAAARRLAHELVRQAVDAAYHAGELAGLALALDAIEKEGDEGDEGDDSDDSDETESAEQDGNADG